MTTQLPPTLRTGRAIEPVPGLPPEKSFRVHWRSSFTGYTGKGARLLTRQDALAWANMMNNVHPGITHWIEFEGVEEEP